MLNPSTADEVKFDPTIKRCYTYAKDWGYGKLMVCNLFALRSTYPQALYSTEIDPIGEDNDKGNRRHARRGGNGYSSVGQSRHLLEQVRKRD